VKHVVWSILLIVVFSHSSKAQSISTLKWKKRIIILMDSEGNHSIRNEQLRKFNDLGEEIRERDLILLCYDGNSLLDQNLRPIPYELSNNIDVDFQGVLLIGKDGGIKLKKSFLVKPKTIFETIDSMPMRKAEMRNSGNN